MCMDAHWKCGTPWDMLFQRHPGLPELGLLRCAGAHVCCKAVVIGVGIAAVLASKGANTARSSSAHVFTYALVRLMIHRVLLGTAL